jgi:hypothetical protein
MIENAIKVNKLSVVYKYYLLNSKTTMISVYVGTEVMMSKDLDPQI